MANGIENSYQKIPKTDGQNDCYRSHTALLIEESVPTQQKIQNNSAKQRRLQQPPPGSRSDHPHPP